MNHIFANMPCYHFILVCFYESKLNLRTEFPQMITSAEMLTGATASLMIKENVGKMDILLKDYASFSIIFV